ncbi:MAG: response regulator [Bdellovibrionota bacterium]
MVRKKSDITLLVVEDEDDFRATVVSMLERSGFKVMSANGGAAAIKILETATIDLILSDIRMPDGDGMFLLDTIRATHPSIPVLIFLTGFAEVRSRICLDRGAHRVLNKPCSRTVLLGAIDEALGIGVEAAS